MSRQGQFSSKVPTPPDAVFDESVLLAQVDFDHALFRLLLETFRDEWPRRAQGLARGFAEADWETVVRQAHTLKGSLRQIGAARAAEAAARVELLAKSADFSALTEAVPHAERELREVDDAVLRRLQREEP